MDICTNCRVGHLQPRHVTYLVPFGRELVTVPGFPAWLCDLCGELSYDESALEGLDMLLGVDAELEPGRRPRSRRPSAESGAGEHAARKRV